MFLLLLILIVLAGVIFTAIYIVVVLRNTGTILYSLYLARHYHHIHIVRVSETLRVEHYFFPNFGRILTKLGMMCKTKGKVTLNLLFLLYYQCNNPSIIVRQHDQGASILYRWPV